jgi:hypothetical protein
MHDDIFADGIGEITVAGTTVRIDLVALSPSERDAENRPRLMFRQRIILPVDGFAGAFEVMQQAFKGLVESGVIRKRPATHPEPTTLRPRDPANPAPLNGSPNFSS